MKSVLTEQTAFGNQADGPGGCFEDTALRRQVQVGFRIGPHRRYGDATMATAPETSPSPTSNSWIFP